MESAASRGAKIVIQPVKDVQEALISQNAGHEHDQGWTKRMVSLAVNGSPDLIATAFRMGPDQFHPLHAHPDMGELYFVFEGACEFQVGDRIEWVEAHTAIYVPRGTPHSIRTRSGGAQVLIVFPEGDLTKVRKTWAEK